jgi:hypothetical protein
MPASSEAPAPEPQEIIFAEDIEPEDKPEINVLQVDSSSFPNVSVYFNIQKANGQMLDIVDAESFMISSESREEPVDVAAPRQQSASAFIYVDANSIDYMTLEKAKAGIEDFMWDLYKQNDRVSVTTQLRKVVAIESSYVTLDRIDRIDGALLYDGLYDVLLEAAREPGPKTVAAIVGGSTGGNSRTLADIIHLAQRTGIAINVIDLSATIGNREIEALASETGGLLGNDTYSDLVTFHSIWNNARSVSFRADNVLSDGKYALSCSGYATPLETQFKANTIKPSSVSASSFKNPEDKSISGPENAIDNRPDTAWIEGKNNFGELEWIELKYPNSEQLSKLVIQNWTDAESLMAYGRIKSIRLDFSDGMELVTIPDPANDLDFVNSSTDYVIDLHKTHYSDFVKITIMHVYNGSSSTDTALSHVGFYR